MTLTRSDIGVWLINLDRATERMARMDAQLSRMDLPYTRVSGVDGKARADELLRTVDVPAFERNTGRHVLPGDIGCYHSHVEVWKLFLDSGKPVALILEDDVVFHDDFLEALDTALAAADRWDIVRFNCIRAKLPITQARLGSYRLNAYVGPYTGNAAYLIHRDVGARLIADLWPLSQPLDHELNRFFLHDYRLFGLEPWSSHPDDGGVSTITGTGFGLVKKFKWYRRLPHYGLKAANYFRRFLWLARNGFIFPRGQLDQERTTKK